MAAVGAVPEGQVALRLGGAYRSSLSPESDGM